MAKLKIFRNDDPATDDPGVDGYVSFIDYGIFNSGNYGRLIADGPSKVPALLNDFAGPSFDVWHELEGGGSERISEDNCRIYVEVDEQKGGAKPRSKHTISLPQTLPNANLSYLQTYVDKIVALQDSDANKLKARKFLFGIMLLTRCR